jgi:hypothetical protein
MLRIGYQIQFPLSDHIFSFPAVIDEIVYYDIVIPFERSCERKYYRRRASMTDVELTRGLERGETPNEGFPHASHLHVAWVYLAESLSVQEAGDKMRATLRRFVGAAGKPQKYHETITLFWVYLLARARLDSGAERLEDVVHANPQLLENNFPLAYYSAERLFSDEARVSWTEPDLKPFSIDAIATCSPSASRDAPDRALS